MRKINIASFVAVVTFFDIFMLGIQWLAAMPGVENAYGYYNDGYDITRFEGLKGSFFNWFSNMIEPVTNGHIETFGEMLPVLLFILWMIVSGVFSGAVLNSKENSKCPWVLIITQAAVAVYWATYIGFAWLR